MYLQVTQDEIMNIPKNTYLWFPIERYSNIKQIIWVEDATYDNGLSAVECTHIDSDGNTQKADYSSNLKLARNGYLRTMNVTTESGKIFDAHIEARLNIREAISASELTGLTSTVWKMADDTIDTVTLDELKEASLLALQKFAYIKGIE